MAASSIVASTMVIANVSSLRASARAPKAAAVTSKPRTSVVVAAAADSDRKRASRRTIVASIVAAPILFKASLARAESDDEEDSVFEAPVAEQEAPVEEEVVAPASTPVPQGNDDPLAAYNAATKTGGNSSTAKAVVAKSKPKESKESGGPGIGGALGVLALAGAGFAAFKAASGGGGDDDEDEGVEYVEEVETKTEKVEEYYEDVDEDDAPKNDFAAMAAAAAAAAAKRDEAAEMFAERKAAAAEAKAAKATASATKIMTRPSEGTQFSFREKEDVIPAFSTRTVRMPSREQNGGDPDSLLPRGFPTIDDLAECETSEEKEEICDKADLLVERLEAKADSAEQFVDGPIVGFFGFLKPNAERNAEKARAVADAAADAAAQLRKAATGGGNGALIAGAVIVAAGAALLLLVGGDGTPSETPAAPSAPRATSSRTTGASKRDALYSAPSVEATKGLYGVEAADLVAKVKSGEGDALAAYEALQRK
jgi:hypothetical protein